MACPIVSSRPCLFRAAHAHRGHLQSGFRNFNQKDVGTHAGLPAVCVLGDSLEDPVCEIVKIDLEPSDNPGEGGVLGMCRPTANHGDILAWALRHGGVPAEVNPMKFDSEPSVLRFLFEGLTAGTPEIRPIGWDEFFAKFDLMGLKMVFDDSPDFEILQDEKASIYRRGANQPVGPS